jgi:parallel beta-helix repeat protein
MIKDSQGAIAIWENSRYNQIENNRIEGCIVSILVSEASQNRISANQIKGGDIGLGLSNSTRNSILDNSIEGSANGLFVRDCIEDDLNNNSIFGSEYGMRMENLSFGTVNGNKIARSRNGIYFANCIKNNVSENSLNEIADTALQAALSNENKFTSNLISDSSMGIILVDDSLNSLSQNRLLNVSRCLYVESSDRVGFDNSIDESNVADSAPLVYLFNRSGEMIEGREMAHLTLAYCENLTIKNSSITKDALFLYASRNNSIIGNNISSCYGMRLWGCNGNEISGNRLLENKFSGMFLYDSNSNEISGNNASLNSQMGISLLSCSGNTIRDNEVIANLASGIWLNLSDENLIRQNNISSNAVGLTVMTSIGNRIYHNNFLNNQEQSEDIGGSNSWDQGNMTGGNFWNDHVAKGNPSEKWPRMIKGGKMSDSYPFQDESGWLLAKASSP